MAVNRTLLKVFTDAVRTLGAAEPSKGAAAREVLQSVAVLATSFTLTSPLLPRPLAAWIVKVAYVGPATTATLPELLGTSGRFPPTGFSKLTVGDATDNLLRIFRGEPLASAVK
jgi:hypothetical protein